MRLYICIPLALSFAAALSGANAWKAASGVAIADPAVTHDRTKSIRLEPDANGAAARVEMPAIDLIPGHRYELKAWVRTSALEVRDSGRSPIAIGAALSMASMPFDMHSVSVAGTRDWTPLSLAFTATTAKDNIVLSAGMGGTFHGQAWFSDVHLEESKTAPSWPSKAGIQTYGPAYRYPDGGWIYVHIEGEPYERGFQHGHLLAHEIETYLDRCAATLGAKDRKATWEWARTQANALFLRGFDQEILQEMKGIADGAAANGAKYDNRKVDLYDIVAANTTTELGLLRSAMPMTPTGLETLHLEPPSYAAGQPDVPVTARCSAFCATGKATRDGKMVIGHVTMWPLTLAEQTNIMLDVQPATGHRVLMQSYPGGIQSGTDWYQNDVGVVLTETTIRQSPFNIEGTPVAYRARKSIQYGDSIDKVVEYLGTKNNGLYTNEWLIADARTNEIAMYELGTYKTRLYRSSKNDWYGGTEGFYWGDNNTKDLKVRLEYQPDPKGSPVHVPYVASERDLMWQNLYEKYRGQIDEQFAFTALRTAPLVTSTVMDSKVATAEMARNQMVWAAFGKPNQREWVPNERQKAEFENDGIYPGGYRLFSVLFKPELPKAATEAPAAAAQPQTASRGRGRRGNADSTKYWSGWILPATPDDTWLSAGAAAYYQALQSETDNQLARFRAGFHAASLGDNNEMHRFEQTSYKGALLIDALRHDMGDEKFYAFMKSFFEANTTKAVTAAQFREAAGAKEQPLFDKWLGMQGLPDDKPGAIYVAGDLHRMSSRLKHTMIVYGTVLEAGSNRYAAEQLQLHMLDWYEEQIPVRKDFEVTDADLRTHDIVFVGRPATNSALSAWKDKLELHYDEGVFTIAGKDHASEKESLAFAAANPLDRKYLVLVLAGNSPLETVRLASVPFENTQYAVFTNGKKTSAGF
jgi:hypothetical protein